MKAPTRLQRLATFNAIGEALNAAPTFAEGAPEALRRLLSRVDLSTGWLFLSNVDEGDTHLGSFRLAASTGLPPALARDDRDPLREAGCECQRLLDGGSSTAASTWSPAAGCGMPPGTRAGSRPRQRAAPGRHGPVGILNLAAPGEKRFDDETLAFLSAVGRQLAVAFERSRLLDERTRHARYAATLEERQRLAHDMHDSLAQLLFAADLSLNVAARHPDAERRQAALRGCGRGGARRARRAARAGGGDAPGGSVGRAACRARAAGAAHPRRASGAPRGRAAEPSPEVAEALYRVAQEAVHNALRHGDAEQPVAAAERLAARACA